MLIGNIIAAAVLLAASTGPSPPSCVDWAPSAHHGTRTQVSAFGIVGGLETLREAGGETADDAEETVIKRCEARALTTPRPA